MNRKQLVENTNVMIQLAEGMYEGFKIRTDKTEILKAVVNYRKTHKEPFFFGIEEFNNVLGTFVILTINGEKVVRLFRIVKDNVSFNNYYENKILEKQGM